MSADGELIPDELAQSILRGLSEKDLAGHSPDETVYILREKWAGREVGNIAFAAAYDWTVTFTDEFERQTSRLDKNLQGRILEAIIDVSKDPLTVRGNTKKPLTGPWAGNWDYRVYGDYRLIYLPDKENMIVELVTFGPRGEVYKQR